MSGTLTGSVQFKCQTTVDTYFSDTRISWTTVWLGHCDSWWPGSLWVLGHQPPMWHSLVTAIGFNHGLPLSVKYMTIGHPVATKPYELKLKNDLWQKPCSECLFSLDGEVQKGQWWCIYTKWLSVLPCMPFGPGHQLEVRALSKSWFTAAH